MQPGAQGSDQHTPREPDIGSKRDAQDAPDVQHTQAAGPVGRQPRSSGVVAAGMGVQFLVSLLVFLFLGQWLDRRLGTAPVFLLGCVFVGAGGSFYAMYRTIVAAQRREDEARAAAKAALAEQARLTAARRARDEGDA
jgi:F0F1-type ATP synthase assembly protein I